ncbi:TraX family protein [Enterococcus faecalis]|uniref:TraX family protein n=1 Tax=Enterococcus faecalis TaxID=1351 RepID=UPI0029366A8D|nr:TraX family protein [Enterococcus faecalis]MDV2933350.1 TraX family protein [Enterococcus faecalis]
MKKYLTGFQLKIIGLITMVIDHLAEFFNFLGVPLWFHWIGRITAPIFLFESSEGFVHTSNRKKYMLRLLVGFWVMNLINLILNQYFVVNGEIIANNVFSTLFLGTVYMQSIAYLKERKFVASFFWFIIPILIGLISFIFTIGEMSTIKMISLQLYTLFVPSLFGTEGGFLMVMLGVLFYIFHGKKHFQVLSLGIVSFISAAATGFSDLFSSNDQWMMFFSAIPIILYNGKKGKGLKSFFYYFYPAHIILFAILSFLLRQ